MYTRITTYQLRVMPVSAGTGNEVHSNVMPRTSTASVDGPLHRWMGKSTFLHVGWMGRTPFHAYDKAANQDMYDFIILITCAAVQKST